MTWEATTRAQPNPHHMHGSLEWTCEWYAFIFHVYNSIQYCVAHVFTFISVLCIWFAPKKKKKTLDLDKWIEYKVVIVVRIVCRAKRKLANDNVQHWAHMNTNAGSNKTKLHPRKRRKHFHKCSQSAYYIFMCVVNADVMVLVFELQLLHIHTVKLKMAASKQDSRVPESLLRMRQSCVKY